MRRLLLHAPNVHVGGGLVLLKELLAASDIGPMWANLDVRASKKITLPKGAECRFVAPSVSSRLRAELALTLAAHDDDLVLCFHGMPPLFPVRGRVIVFQQNRNYLGLNALSTFSGRTRLRTMAERIICTAFKGHVNEYIVQTPAMQSAVTNWHGGNPRVRVIPFMKPMDLSLPARTATPTFDFIYVADGEGHKNHRTLLAAWALLAKEGIFPSLGLTLPDRFVELRFEIDRAVAAHGVNIRNLGAQSHEAVLQLYRSAEALIFPSTSESFGLPLLEAARAGLPIVASELDFVRDVCVPAETFDPASPVSIARAVKRFSSIPATPLLVRSAAEFLKELQQ